MEKFTDYKVLYDQSISITAAAQNLAQSVQRYLLAGWVPQGGVSISVCTLGYTESYTVAQAMVKIEKA